MVSGRLWGWDLWWAYKTWCLQGTVGTKSIADPEEFQGTNLWKSTDLLQDGPCLELIIVSSNFQALLFLQDNLLESVWKLLIPVKESSKLLDRPFPDLIQ